METDEIHKNMLQILEDKKVLTINQLEKKWAVFMSEFPLIFISLSKEDVDKNMLKLMINKIKEVRSGKKEHDKAEKEFGEIMADKYIYTKFEKPSEEELNVAYQKALKNKEAELRRN